MNRDLSAADINERAPRLTPRQQLCLRRLYERKSPKEISAELNIQPATIYKYIAEAVQTLGATNSRQASIAFHFWENRDRAPTDAPDFSGAVFLGLSDASKLSSSSIPAAPWWARFVPFRYKDAPGNDLSISARFFWFAILALATAVGFGALASGAHLISVIVRPSRVGP